MRWHILQHYKHGLLFMFSQLHNALRGHSTIALRRVFVRPQFIPHHHHTDDTSTMSIAHLLHHPHLMVTGGVGAGKTVLLYHIALAYAEAKHSPLPPKTVPIYLELYRLNNPDVTLMHAIVQAFDACFEEPYANSETYIRHLLKKGQLVLLLDGLDSINEHHRMQVIHHISEFIHAHPTCRVVITCRDAVANDVTFSCDMVWYSLAPFTNEQLTRLLNAWQQQLHMHGRSVEQLLLLLHNDEPLLSLCRNPLMATILVYLYSRPRFLLPRNRALFCHTATTILLEQWHQTRNRYESNIRRVVLYHLALHWKTTPSAHDYHLTVQHIHHMLRELGKPLPHYDAESLLLELIERSGMVQLCEDGERVQFISPLLHDFFAAMALIETTTAITPPVLLAPAAAVEGDVLHPTHTPNPHNLLRRFVAQPTVWHEVVLLWCGLVPDSTPLVRAITRTDALTALHCLAYVRGIDNTIATLLLTAFHKQFGRINSINRRKVIVQIFGAIATDSRIRGRDTYAFLHNTLETATNPLQRLAAALSLSYTCLPAAAVLLAEQYQQHAELRVALLRMGDGAIDALMLLLTQAPATNDERDIPGDIWHIGTKKAACNLVTLLWHPTEPVAVRAAWYLGNLLQRADIEAVLHRYTLPATAHHAPWLDWIWQPFQQPHTQMHSALPVIAGRIAHLIVSASPDMMPTHPVTLDPRLAMPLCLSQANEALVHIHHLEQQTTRWIQKTLSILANSALQSEQTPHIIAVFVAQVMHHMAVSKRWHALFASLPTELQFRVLQYLFDGSCPTIDDWRTIRQPPRWVFHTRPNPLHKLFTLCSLVR